MQRSLTTVCDLLSSCFSLTSEDLARINLASSKQGLTQGEFLYREGAVSAQVVRAAILCQLYMKDRLLPAQLAVSAVRLVNQINVPIEEALNKLGWDRAYYENISQMSELLVKSETIDEQAKAVAYELCFDNRLPFLAALMQRQALSGPTADYALTLQHAILRGELSFNDAVELLRKHNHKDDETVKGARFRSQSRPLDVPVTSSTKGIRLGELLVAARLITSVQLIAAVEQGRTRGQLVGEVLVEEGALSPEALETALSVQSKIDNGELSVEEGVNALSGPTETFAGGFAQR
jgi:hypothetical protein